MLLLRKSTLSIVLPIIVLFISACTSKESTPRKNLLLTDPDALTIQDVLDVDPTKEITEQTIQEAIKLAHSATFTLKPGAKIILVQSGATAPDSIMQQAMMDYYQVSIYSGITPSKARAKLPRKSEKPVGQPETSYIKTLRLAAAKAKQDKIIVYWGHLELGKLDSNAETLIWQRYTSDTIPSTTKQLRYLIRFALVDVKTGMWTMYSSINHQHEYVGSIFNRHENDAIQINRVKEESYRLAAQSLANHFMAPFLKVE